MSTQTNRRMILWGLLALFAVVVVAACAPAAPPVEVTRVVEVTKEVKVVETQQVEVTKEVQVEVTAAPRPLRTVRFTHGGSLCNLALFLSFEHPEWWAEEGLSPESVPSPSINEQIAALNLGLVDFSGAPYTSQIASIAQSDGTLKIFTGIGVGGLGLLAHKETSTPDAMKGTTWGLSPSDTLEVLGFEWLKQNNLSYDDIEIVYEAAGTDVTAAWIAGQIDVVNCVQPFCNDMAQQYDGVLLTDGRDIFGGDYSDCVLATSTKLLSEEPEVAQGVIKVLMRAQQMIEADLEGAIDTTMNKWFKVADKNIPLQASEFVHPMIDQRSQQDFIMNGVNFMLELGYVSSDLAGQVDSPDKVFDWSALEATIAANPELYASLERKSP